MGILIEPGARVLFQGDSITDAGRSRENDGFLGSGYAALISACLGAKYPELNITFINRGISGNRVDDLEKRWDADCCDLKPDWLSVLIGINDTAQASGGGSKQTVEEFEASYRRILDRAKAAGSKHLVLMEPFVLASQPMHAEWRRELDPRIHAVRRIAIDYGAILIPLDGLFAAASCRREPAFWSPDGVHLTGSGNALVAEEWIKAVSR